MVRIKIFVILVTFLLICQSCFDDLDRKQMDMADEMAYNSLCRGVLCYSVNPNDYKDSILCIKSDSRGYKIEEHLYFLKESSKDPYFISILDSLHQLDTIFLITNEHTSVPRLYKIYPHPVSIEDTNYKTTDTISIGIGNKIGCSGSFINDTLVVSHFFPYYDLDNI